MIAVESLLCFAARRPFARIIRSGTGNAIKAPASFLVFF
jgi:hypothetical protein